MAGGAGGGAMIGAAERGCGTILRGSGRAGAPQQALQQRESQQPAWRAAQQPWPAQRQPAFTGPAPAALISSSLLGQQGLHHIARLGDVREIDLGHYGFCAVAARRCPRVRAALRFPRKMRANLLSLVKLQRAGVRLARRNADSGKNVENRPRLYFQLFCEIVNTNLTHPPLFNVCRQQTVSRS